MFILNEEPQAILNEDFLVDQFQLALEENFLIESKAKALSDIDRKKLDLLGNQIDTILKNGNYDRKTSAIFRKLVSNYMHIAFKGATLGIAVQGTAVSFASIGGMKTIGDAFGSSDISSKGKVLGTIGIGVTVLMTLLCNFLLSKLERYINKKLLLKKNEDIMADWVLVLKYQSEMKKIRNKLDHSSKEYQEADKAIKRIERLKEKRSLNESEDLMIQRTEDGTMLNLNDLLEDVDFVFNTYLNESDDDIEDELKNINDYIKKNFNKLKLRLKAAKVTPAVISLVSLLGSALMITGAAKLTYDDMTNQGFDSFNNTKGYKILAAGTTIKAVTNFGKFANLFSIPETGLIERLKKYKNLEPSESDKRILRNAFDLFNKELNNLEKTLNKLKSKAKTSELKARIQDSINQLKHRRQLVNGFAKSIR